MHEVVTMATTTFNVSFQADAATLMRAFGFERELVLSLYLHDFGVAIDRVPSDETLLAYLLGRLGLSRQLAIKRIPSAI
jgi:hypothetical protein